MPGEHMAALALYDGGLGDVEAVSNDQPMEVALDRHFDRLKRISPNVMNNEGACLRADQHSAKVVKHFLDLGLIRPLLPNEVPRLQKDRLKHAAEFAPYARV